MSDATPRPQPLRHHAPLQMRSAHRTVALVYALGVIVSLLLFLTVRGWERAHLRSQFERLAEDRAQAVKGQVDRNLETLDLIGSFYASSRLVEREEFRTFVSDSLIRHPEIRALNWTPWIAAGERAAYEAALQAEGFPEAQVTEEDQQGRFVRAGERQAYAPVTYMEPFAPRRALLGFDLASDAIRRAAMDRARDTGAAAATAVVSLKGPGRPMGFGMYMPIYRNGLPHETLDDRRRHLHGFVIAVFAVSPMIEYAIQPLPPAGIDLSFYEAPLAVGPPPFYVRRAQLRPPRADAMPARPDAPSWLRWKTTIHVAGRAWVMQCAASPAFFAAHRRWESLVLLVFGLLVTALVGGRMRQTLLRAAQVERLVVERTAELSREIAERRRAEETLHQFSTVVEQSDESVMITDTQGVIQYVNPAFERLTGYASVEAVSRTPTILKSHRHEQAFYADLWNTVLAGRVYRAVIVNRRKDGSLYDSEKTITPLRDRAGRITHFVSTDADVTERRQADRRREEQTAELVRNHAELLHQRQVMQSLLEDLQTSKAQLEQSYHDLKAAQLQLIQAEKFESVGRLSAGVAHEVKNPLAILLMGVEYLTTRPGPQDRGTADVLEDMRQAVGRADAIVRGLIDFSASQELHLAAEDIHDLLEHALLLVKHEMDKSHILVTKAYAAGLPRLRLDRMKIEQVFVNLFMNAVHAMPHGGLIAVTTSVRQLAQGEHDVGSRRADRFAVGERVVVVEVADGGTGIAEEHLHKIFDPFFTTKPTGQGTGLGLTVVRKIMALHGGAVAAANRPQGGVRMTLTFKMEGGESHGQEKETARPHH